MWDVMRAQQGPARARVYVHEGGCQRSAPAAGAAELAGRERPDALAAPATSRQLAHARARGQRGDAPRVAESAAAPARLHVGFVEGVDGRALAAHLREGRGVSD